MSNSVSISLSDRLTYRDFVKFPTLHYNTIKGKKQRFLGDRESIQSKHDFCRLLRMSQQLNRTQWPYQTHSLFIWAFKWAHLGPISFFYFDLFLVFVFCCNATEQFSTIQQVCVFDNPQCFCYWGRAFSYWNSSRYLHKSRRYYHSTAKCIYALCLSQFYLICCLIYNMTCFTKLSDHHFVCRLHWQFTERGSSLNARYVWF